MSELNAADFDLLSFDCYGTLVDWESAIVECVQSILPAHDAHLNDAIVLEMFSEYEPKEQSAGGSYRGVLRRVLGRYGYRLGFKPRDEELTRFEECVARAQPFSDTLESLKTLQKHFKLAIISNTDVDLFEITQRSLGIEFDHVVTAQESACYKAELKIFEKAFDAFGADTRVLHVAQSLFHDIKPATELGVSTAWIDRTEGRRGAARPAKVKPDWKFKNLADFTEAVIVV